MATGCAVGRVLDGHEIDDDGHHEEDDEDVDEVAQVGEVVPRALEEEARALGEHAVEEEGRLGRRGVRVEHLPRVAQGWQWP